MFKAIGPRRELGTRYTCYSCGAKFYDLHRPEPLCPKCGADQRESPEELLPRTRISSAGKAASEKDLAFPIQPNDFITNAEPDDDNESGDLDVPAFDDEGTEDESDT